MLLSLQIMHQDSQKRHLRHVLKDLLPGLDGARLMVPRWCWCSLDGARWMVARWMVARWMVLSRWCSLRHQRS
jgi:hypothetical protein